PTPICGASPLWQTSRFCCRYAPLKDVLALIFDAIAAAKTAPSAVLSAALLTSPLFEHTP
ncbi:MAG: hypothetical protein WBQ89_13685, partial [Candidatus Acidiferrum sp.]